MAEVARKRPKYLNLVQIRLPLAGFASILHRVSGAGLFLMLPLLIWLLDLSLVSAEGYAKLMALVAHPLLKLILIGLLWAFLHHFFMGIRILLLDIHIAIDKVPSRRTAIAVMAVSLALTALLGAKLW
jgi:succinate dehydrogenase / fumarate reductase, cytochrome b subunit